MKPIKYIGPFLQVKAEGVSFTRHMPVEVTDLNLRAKLLNAKIDNKNVFAEVSPEPVLVEDEN